METLLLAVILAVVGLAVSYTFLDKYKKEKKSSEPQTYVEGLRALLEGRDELAFARFREVVADDSANVDAYIRIGNILRKYGKPDRALQIHKDLTLRHGLTKEDKIAILSALGDDFAALGDFASSITALKEIISLEPGNRPAHDRLLSVYCRLGIWDEAFEIRENLLKLNGDKSRNGLAIFRYFQAKKLYDDKKFHKARVLFKEAIGFDEKCVPAYIWIGDSYIAENRLEDAVDIWRKMLRAVPDEAHLVMGRIKKALFELGRFGEISEICRELIEVSSSNLVARLTLADYYTKKGENAMAIEHLRTAAENHPESYLPHLELAKLYLISKDTQRLRELIDRLDRNRESREYEYRCRKCGHIAKEKVWLCPKCYAVDSFAR